MTATEAHRKFQFIEVVLQWEGGLTTNKLQNYFAIGSRTTAYNLIKDYRKNFPDNLKPYDAKVKSHQPAHPGERRHLLARSRLL